MNPEKINFTILCGDHNCREFDCGDQELNNFLVEDALSNQIMNIYKFYSGNPGTGG